jgi:Predicted acetyltransferase
MSELFLVEPDEQYRDGFINMVLDYRDYGEEYYFDKYKEALTDFEGFIAKLRAAINGEEDWVPSHSFWLTNTNKEILGVVRVRTSLENEEVRKYAGHIGYDIPPHSRKKGYGSNILRLALEKAAMFGIDKVLITCADHNIASGKIIEKNGGVFESMTLDDDGQTPLRRYWIDIGKGINS